MREEIVAVLIMRTTTMVAVLLIRTMIMVAVFIRTVIMRTATIVMRTLTIIIRTKFTFEVAVLIKSQSQ